MCSGGRAHTRVRLITHVRTHTAHAHAHTHACICTRTSAHAHTSMYTRAHVHTRKRAHAHMCSRVCRCILAEMISMKPLLAGKAGNNDWLRAPPCKLINPNARQDQYHACGACPESGSAGRALKQGTEVKAHDTQVQGATEDVRPRTGRPLGIKVSDKISNKRTRLISRMLWCLSCGMVPARWYS